MAVGSLISTTGTVTISADAVNLQGQILAPVVKIAPDTPGTSVNLGAGASAGFALTDSELNTIRAPIVRIGDGTGAAPFAGATAGDITFVGSFTPAATFATDFLELRTTGNVTATAGALNFGTSGGNLVARANGLVNIAHAGHLLNTLAVGGATGAFAGSTTVRIGIGDLTVGTVDGFRESIPTATWILPWLTAT